MDTLDRSPQEEDKGTVHSVGHDRLTVDSAGVNRADTALNLWVNEDDGGEAHPQLPYTMVLVGNKDFIELARKGPGLGLGI